MTGGGSVVMATHRSATATRNRVEPRPHRTLPADAPRRHASIRSAHASSKRVPTFIIIDRLWISFSFLSFSIEKKTSAFSSLVQNPSPPKFKGEKNLSKAPFRDCINLIRSMERIRVLIVNSDFDHFLVIMSFLR